MIGLVVGLLLAQSVAAQHKSLDAAMKAKRFVEVAQLSRKLLSASGPREYSPLLSRLTRALAEQKQCGSTREKLSSSTADRFLLAQLDTAAGDFAKARATLSSTIEPLLNTDAGRPDPSMADALNFLALLERLSGDPRRAAELSARGVELKEKAIRPDPFDLAVSQLEVAFEKQDVEAWTRAIESLEQIGGAQHALVAVALENRAAAYERAGKADAAKRDRERASKVTSSGWCR